MGKVQRLPRTTTRAEYNKFFEDMGLDPKTVIGAQLSSEGFTVSLRKGGTENGHVLATVVPTYAEVDDISKPKDLGQVVTDSEGSVVNIVVSWKDWLELILQGPFWLAEGEETNVYRAMFLKSAIRVETYVYEDLKETVRMASHKLDWRGTNEMVLDINHIIVLD